MAPDEKLLTTSTSVSLAKPCDGMRFLRLSARLLTARLLTESVLESVKVYPVQVSLHVSKCISKCTLKCKSVKALKGIITHQTCLKRARNPQLCFSSSHQKIVLVCSRRATTDSPPFFHYRKKQG